MRVRRYTEHEGGQWKPWPMGPVPLDVFERRGPIVTINGLTVHAMDSDWGIWDSVNGFRPLMNGTRWI